MPIQLTIEQTALWNRTVDEVIKILKQRISAHCVEPEDDELRRLLRQTLDALRAQRV